MVTQRRDRLKQELRQEILDAARDLFVKEGYASVSMRRIADAVGCAPGTLYLHFEDKSAILGAICTETFEKLGKRMQAIAQDRGGDPLESLRRSGRLYIQFAMEHPQHYLVTFGGAGGLPGTPAAMESGQKCFVGLRSCVRTCVEAGLTRTPDVEQLAQSIWSCVHGVVMLLITKRGHFPFIEESRLVEGLLEMVIEGVRKK